MRGDQVAETGDLISMPDETTKKQKKNGTQNRHLIFDDSKHQEKMLTFLNTMRREGHFCDATLEVGGHNVPVHRAVLASCSVYMFELFSGKEESRVEHHFKLDSLDYASFAVLVNYAYTARLECDADLVKSVYKTASVLKMHKVAEQCSRFLAENLTPQTCLGIRAFASSYNDLDLTSKTNVYVNDNLQTIIERSAEFARLSSVVVDIVGVEPSGLNSSGEKQLSQLVVDWLELALEERPLERLMEHPQILHLANDNRLRDCLGDLEDLGLNNSDIIRDYKKLGKRKQLLPVKGNKDKATSNGGGPLSNSPSLPLPGSGATFSDSADLFDDVQAKNAGQFCVVATKLVGDKSFMCIAILNDSLTSISIKFRPQKNVVVELANGKHETTSSSSTTASERRKCHSPVEKQCSLTPLAHMSSARCGLGTAVLNGRLIALGGYDRGECLSSVEAFDVKSNAWSPLKPMQTARGRFAVAQMDNKLYSCGGCNGLAELNSVECYDPENDQWSNIPEMTIKRSSAGVTVCNGMLYVIGGWSGCSGHTACEVYDPGAEEWKAIADLNFGRSQAGVCTIDDEIIAVGGCDAWNCTNTVEIYDRTNNKWTYLPPMSVARRGAGVAYFKDKLYIIGGSDGQASLTSVEVYDHVAGMWSFGPCLTTPRANMGIAIVDRRLFAVGGFSGKTFLESIEFLSEDGSEWCIYVPPAGCVGVVVAGETGDGGRRTNGDATGTSSDGDEDVVRRSATSSSSNAVEDATSALDSSNKDVGERELFLRREDEIEMSFDSTPSSVDKNRDLHECKENGGDRVRSCDVRDFRDDGDDEESFSRDATKPDDEEEESDAGNF